MVTSRPVVPVDGSFWWLPGLMYVITGTPPVTTNAPLSVRDSPLGDHVYGTRAWIRGGRDAHLSTVALVALLMTTELMVRSEPPPAI